MRASWFLFLFLLLVLPRLLPAVDLEEEPDEDVGAVDQASEDAANSKVETLRLITLDEPPVVDGILDDVFWQRASAADINMELYPERFAEAVVATDVLVASTATHLYLGITAHDPNPEQMYANRRARDGVRDGDYVSIVVDPTGNLRRKFEFRVNPYGSISDVLQNTVSNRYIYDWDARWESAARITDSGYVVEMEIPIDSIKQPVLQKGETPRWLVILKRTYPRAVDHTFGKVYIFEGGQELVTDRHEKRLELVPYFIFHPDEERSSTGLFEQIKDHDNTEVGLDAKLVLSSASQVAVTINPNYTEVERDIARKSINQPFTPFEPEKRLFFQEGKELYSTLMPIVYTRNIEQPEYGLDFTYTGNRSSAGGMWMSDEATRLIMPDNLGSDTVEIEERPGELLAARYVTGDRQRSTGLILTARQGEDYHNYVGGIDGLINLGLDDKIRYQLMYSSTDYPEDFAQDLCEGDDCLSPPPENCLLGECDYTAQVLRADPSRSLQGHGLRLSYKHDSPKGLYWVNYFDYSEDFRADFGLDRRTDYRMINAALGKNWFFQALKRDKGKSRLRFYLVGQHLQSSAGETIENGVDLWGEFRGSYQTVLRAGYRIKDRAVNRIDQGSLALGSNAPLFDERYWQWYYEAVPYPFLTFNLDGRYGDIADTNNLVLGKMLELKPRLTLMGGGARLELSQTYRNFDQDDEELWQENFSTVQISYGWNRNHAFRLLYLFDRTDRDVGRFLADELTMDNEGSFEATYLYKPTTGLSVLLGAKVEQEDDSDPDPGYTTGRQVYLKLVYDLDDAVRF